MLTYLERLKITLESEVQLYIVTTKEGRFVKQLLQQEGVNLPPENIFGKEVKRPKYETLRELINKVNTQNVSLWFVEDRLKTLQVTISRSRTFLTNLSNRGEVKFRLLGKFVINFTL